MYTIAENKTNEIEIKKSKFIAKLYKVYNVEDVSKILRELKEKYSDATHICYAYKIDSISKFSDDKEPGGTAGLPMMEVINKNQLDFILAVVIRYFGGIKLGSGGLVRAYSSSISEVLKKTKIKEIIPGYLIKIICSYEDLESLNYILKDSQEVKREYLEQVTSFFIVDNEQLEKLKEWNPTIIEERKIEKMESLEIKNFHE